LRDPAYRGEQSSVRYSLRLVHLRPLNEPAPRFNAKTTTGEKFTNDTIKGRFVCSISDNVVRVLLSRSVFVDELNQEYGDKGLIVLSIDSGVKTVEKYLKQYPRKSRVLTDESGGNVWGDGLPDLRCDRSRWEHRRTEPAENLRCSTCWQVAESDRKIRWQRSSG
jgi:hypothetical protein